MHVPTYGYRLLPLLSSIVLHIIIESLKEGSPPERNVSLQIMCSYFPNMERYLHEQFLPRVNNVDFPFCVSRTKGLMKWSVCWEGREKATADHPRPPPVTSPIPSRAISRWLPSCSRPSVWWNGLWIARGRVLPTLYYMFTRVAGQTHDQACRPSSSPLMWF